ncbi:MAG: hypothetical protein AAFU64_03390 [Bacteroidota bacterium]
MSDILFTQADWQLFTNINTLPQQAGVSKHLLPKLIAKELMDNALDTGAKVDMRSEKEGLFEDTIIIRDYGAGFPGDPAQIANLFSINRPLTSSKRFRLPSRGALGNGLRVVTATVYCTGGSLEVASNGKRMKLIPQDDGHTAYEILGDFEGEGTEIKVHIPDNFFGDDILEWAQLALDINRGTSFAGKTNPHWYDSDSFYNLLLSTPEAVAPVRFLENFDKLNPSRAKKLLKALEEELQADIASQALADWTRTQADKLLGKMRELSKALHPKKLGEMGGQENFPAYTKAAGSFTLKTTKGNFDAQIPYVMEVFAATDTEGKSRFFVNKTPITGEVVINYYQKRISVYGCGLSLSLEVAKLSPAPYFWVNIICPYMPIVSNGKEPDLSFFEESLQDLLRKTINQLKKLEKSEKSAHHFSITKAPSQKKVVIQNIDPAIQKASGQGQYRYSLRQLYYVMRPMVMQETGRELRYANFSNIITDYEFETGQDLPGIYRDERGTLLHPHSHQEVKLGTKNIEQYQRPIYNFNKILYSEKEGFFEILKDAGFCEKYDCALLTSKGFASRAARDVIDLLAETEEELFFFCIHDADLSGTLIYQALQGATRARPERKVHILNLGLEPWEGLEMGLEVEKLEKRSTKTAAQYILDFDQKMGEKKPFQFEAYDRWAEWQEWLKYFRIELNAMDTPTFLDWLDRKFSDLGIGKVIPQETYLKDRAEDSLEAGLRSRIREALMQQLNLDQMIESKLREIFPEALDELKKKELAAEIRKSLDNRPQQSWENSFSEQLAELMKYLDV